MHALEQVVELTGKATSIQWRYLTHMQENSIIYGKRDIQFQRYITQLKKKWVVNI